MRGVPLETGSNQRKGGTGETTITLLFELAKVR